MLSHVHIGDESVDLRTVADILSHFIELALHSIFVNLHISVLVVDFSCKSLEGA